MVAFSELRILYPGSYTLKGMDFIYSNQEYTVCLSITLTYDQRVIGAIHYESPGENYSECSILNGKWSSDGHISYTLLFDDGLYTAVGYWYNDVFAGIFWDNEYEKWDQTPNNRKGEFKYSFATSYPNTLPPSIIQKVKWEKNVAEQLTL